MLTRLLSEHDNKNIQLYQKKLTAILGSFVFSVTLLLNMDIFKLAKIVENHHLCKVLHWSNCKFIDVINKFQERASSQISKYLNDYTSLARSLSLRKIFQLPAPSA
jgi:hypothetical protein